MFAADLPAGFADGARDLVQLHPVLVARRGDEPVALVAVGRKRPPGPVVLGDRRHRLHFPGLVLLRLLRVRATASAIATRGPWLLLRTPRRD